MSNAEFGFGYRVGLEHDPLDLQALPGVVRSPLFHGGGAELAQNFLVGLCSAGVDEAVHDVLVPGVRGA